jgi:hypothetical protein
LAATTFQIRSLHMKCWWYVANVANNWIEWECLCTTKHLVHGSHFSTKSEFCPKILDTLCCSCRNPNNRLSKYGDSRYLLWLSPIKPAVGRRVSAVL